MHAPLAVHACTKLGTTAQILQRTYRKGTMHLQKYLSGLREKRIALCEKWAMRFVEKACAFLKWDSPFSEKASAFLYTLSSNQSRPLVLLDGSDFCNGRLRQIY